MIIDAFNLKEKCEMNITIVGAGNMGLALVSYLAVYKNHSVTLFTDKKFEKLILNDVETQQNMVTTRFKVTNSNKAFSEADYIFCTWPAFLRKKMINQYGKYIKSGTKIGFVPGYGGIEYSCNELIKKGVIIFGFQRVPYVARAIGNKAGILSKKSKLFLATIPSTYTDTVVSDIESFFDIPVSALKEYLSITLAPSNPLLHISGLYGAFKDYDARKGYIGKQKFYEQWDDETSKILFQYDKELQSICKALSPIDLKEVVPLPIYYESDSPEKLTQKLKSIESFKVVRVPLAGNAPDLNSRMFIEDYPYGICIIKDIARMLEIETPIIDMLLSFYTKISGHVYFNSDNSYSTEIYATGVPGIYGLKTKADLIDFYHKGH